jgi:hypothetical protein
MYLTYGDGEEVGGMWVEKVTWHVLLAVVLTDPGDSSNDACWPFDGTVFTKARDVHNLIYKDSLKGCLNFFFFFLMGMGFELPASSLQST